MAVNKVEINGETKLDLTGDTVTPETLLSGATAHNAAGEQIDGAVSVAPASNTTPKAPGTASAGSESGYARGDHVHPSDPTKQSITDEIQASRLRGGILSVGYSGKSTAINPSINGLGFALYRGATVRAFYDDYEMETGVNTLNHLFDGLYGTYVNFVTGVGGAYTWDASIKYPAGAYVRFYRNSRYEWYKSTKENTGVDPLTDASGIWINKNVAETGTYASFLDLTGVSVCLEFTFPNNVNLRYENSTSLYWRAPGQNASHVKVEKYDKTVGWFAVFDNDNTADNIINNIYLGTNVPGITSSVQNKIRFTFQFRDAQKWCCLNQIAFSGIVGGIEGTLVNRGGSTMYGNLSPYAAGGASLGVIGNPWKEIRGQYFYGDLANAFVKFSLASTREFLTTGETLTKSFGKIQKWFADLGTLAFKSSVAKSDLASAVQTSLGKADTALQEETDPTVPAWAKSANKPTYTASEVGALPSTTSIPQPTSTTPKAPGTATAGTSSEYARGDHVHPRELPTVSASDNGKFLRVVSGAWAAVSIANANGGSF